LNLTLFLLSLSSFDFGLF